jgi:hypothetical protein
MSQQCDKFKEMFSEFIDNELGQDLSQELQLHLEQCTPCKKEFNFLKLTAHVVKNMKNPAAPQDFLSKLRMRIDAEVVAKPSLWKSATRWLMVHPTLLATSFAVIFVSAFVLGRISPAPQVAGNVGNNKVALVKESQPASASAKSESVAPARAPQPAPDMGARTVSDSSEMEAYRSPRISAPSMAMPVGFSASGASVEPVRVRAYPIQTETQLIINLLRRDPLFQNAKVYPIKQGAVAQTDAAIYRITISTQNFINAMSMIRAQGLPESMDQAVKAFNLDIEKMPNPLQP